MVYPTTATRSASILLVATTASISLAFQPSSLSRHHHHRHHNPAASKIPPIHSRIRQRTPSRITRKVASQDDEEAASKSLHTRIQQLKKEEEQQQQQQQEKNREEERTFFLEEDALQHVASLEEMLEELEALGMDAADDDHDDFNMEDDWDEQSLEEFFQSLPEQDDENISNINDDGDDDLDETYLDMAGFAGISLQQFQQRQQQKLQRQKKEQNLQKQQEQSASLLENALLQGVVPANAGVGSNCLPGDYDFDPLDLASKDYFPRAQAFVQSIIPESRRDDDNDGDDDSSGVDKVVALGPRPQALILRDYREAEIRHGRLAMLAAIFWPLQELTDRLVLDEDQFDSLLHSLFFGGVTLPYLPLLMTAIMLLLGYLDIYSQAIKDMDKIGEAFLPGDCFWDPLQMLTGAPDQMKRNMQERELFNGRFAMLAIAVFIWEEATTGKPLVGIEGNQILFEPAYQVPFVQEQLDRSFSTPSPVFFNWDDAASAAASTELLMLTIRDTFQLTTLN